MVTLPGISEAKSQNDLNNYNPPPQMLAANPMAFVNTRNNLINANVSENNEGSFIQVQNFAPQQGTFQEKLSFDIPSLQLGTGRMRMGMEMRSRNSNFSAKSSSYALHKWTNKWHKTERKWKEHFSNERKLKFKVDKCFKWS